MSPTRGMQQALVAPKFEVAAISRGRNPVARRMRLFFGLTGVLVVLAGFALPSDAGLLGTGSASYCDPYSFQAFRPWSDASNYMLAPGGACESGAPAWTLAGGAKVTSGNESYYIHSKS